MKEAVSGECNASPAVSDGVERRELTATHCSRCETTVDGGTSPRPMPANPDANQNRTGQDEDLGSCPGLYRCTTCRYKTAQSRKCPRCGGEVECDA